MKRANGEMRVNSMNKNDVQFYNTCMAPKYTVNQNKKAKKKRKYSAKEIVAVIMMVLGVSAIILSLIEAYCMDHYEYYAQYIIMSIDVDVAIEMLGLVTFIGGSKLAMD